MRYYSCILSFPNFINIAINVEYLRFQPSCFGRSMVRMLVWYEVIYREMQTPSKCRLTYMHTEAQVAIADERSVALLKSFASDDEPLVAQSCAVALHMLELEQQGKSFEVGCTNPECGGVDHSSTCVLAW